MGSEMCIRDRWKRAGPITQRSVDRNHALLNVFLVPYVVRITISIHLVSYGVKNNLVNMKSFDAEYAF